LASVAELADDLAWRNPNLSWKAEYLRFPIRFLGL